MLAVITGNKEINLLDKIESLETNGKINLYRGINGFKNRDG